MKPSTVLYPCRRAILSNSRSFMTSVSREAQQLAPLVASGSESSLRSQSFNDLRRRRRRARRTVPFSLYESGDKAYARLAIRSGFALLNADPLRGNRRVSAGPNERFTRGGRRICRPADGRRSVSATLRIPLAEPQGSVEAGPGGVANRFAFN
jgi:hypothetical protein